MTKPPAWFKTEGVLGTRYKSKSALTDAMRAIINPRQEGDVLSGNDFLFVMDVLRHHPAWDEKQGSGVRRIVVRMNYGAHFANKGVWLERLDGTTVDISWPTAINAEHKSYHHLVRDAARHAIADQVAAARSCGQVCSICDQPVTDSGHVDHTPPHTFDAIFSGWINGRGQVMLRDDGLHPVFADADVLADWQEYHRLFADLRLTHALCNLTHKGRGK